MATKKSSSARKTSKPTKKIIVKKPQVSSSQGAQYDSMMIVTILLLVFVYPLGIVFMWLLMKNWPTWLKLVITLPLLIAVFFTVVVVFIVGQEVGNVNWNKVQKEHQQYEQMQVTPTTSPYRF